MRLFQSAARLLCYSSIWMLSTYKLFYSICFSSFVFAVNIYGEEAVCSTDGACNNYEDDELDLSWRMNSNITLEEMWDALDCDDFFDNNDPENRPIHNESTWMLLRGVYVGASGDDVDMAAYDKQQWFGSGFRPGSIEVRIDEQSGRGVFAKESFKKGEVVRTDLFAACFTSGASYRSFLASIPRELACDVFEWAYSGKEGTCVDLDEGSLINHAARKKYYLQDWESGDQLPNIHVPESGIYAGYDIALRDINPGEEILADYAEFDDPTEWQQIGLGRWHSEE